MPATCWLWLLALAFVAFPRDARATPAYGNITVDLRGEGSLAPTHMCVVSGADGPRTRGAILDDLLTGQRKSGADRLVHPRAWRGAENADAPAARCGEDDSLDCRAQVRLPPGLDTAAPLYVACTADSLATTGGHSDDARLLVLHLENLDAAQPAIDSVQLAGGVATIGVQNDLRHVVVTARSLGGHYAPDRWSQRESDGGDADKVVVLNTVPRCRWIETSLPATMGNDTEGRLRVRIHGHDVDESQCVQRPSERSLRVRVPHAPSGGGDLEVNVMGPEDEGGQTSLHARYGLRWIGAWPPSPTTLETRAFRFTWTPPQCLLPRDECPAVTLEDHGIACTATPGRDRCEYTCPMLEEALASDTALEFPLRLRFEKQRPHQVWTSTLARAGQTIATFVDPEDIVLTANLTGWIRDAPGNRITAVDIYGEDGQPRRFQVTHVPHILLPLPRASCEPLRFRPVGDRDYGDAVATVHDGELDFGPPHRRARITSFHLTTLLGFGPTVPPDGVAMDGDPRPIFFSGLVQFAMRFRARRAPLNRLGAELRLGGTLGQWGDFEEQLSGESTGQGQRLRDFGWARIMAEPALVAALHDRVSASVGFAFGTSFPFRSDRELDDSSFRLVLSPSADVRLHMRRWVAFVLQFRPFFDFMSATDENGVQTSAGTASNYTALGGLELSF